MPALAHPVRMRLYRFELQRDKLATFDEWMRFLAAERPAVFETLEREKMYLEVAGARGRVSDSNAG